MPPRSTFHLLSLALLVLSFGLNPTPVSAEEGTEPSAKGDAVILATGARLACTIESLTDETVVVRVKDQTYTFERETLKATIRDGATLPRPGMLRFVRALAPHLVSSDETIRGAASKALEALGEAGRAAVTEIGRTLRDPAKRKALGLPEIKAPLAPALRARIQEETKRARRLVDLAPKQEAGFEAALETFIRSVTTGGDATKARAALDAALAKVLTKDQLEKLRAQ